MKVLLSQEQIAARIAELAKKIEADYAHVNEPLVLVGVLKGSFIFLADLCRAIERKVEIEFMGVSSYGDATESSGVVQITQDLTKPIKGRHVIIVEDIVDTGLTAKYLLENFGTREPAGVKIAALLEKPSKNNGGVRVDYLGFAIGDEFVVGYGLDYAGVHRNLPYIGVMG